MVVLRFPVKSPLKAGFTLVELSIVLVIIGLIIGGVLVGRDLIGAAEVRAQLSQIEKYQTAVNTFRGKYGYLPGDIPNPTANQYGFLTRGQYAGEGDGNGILEGVFSDGAGQNVGYGPLIAGEMAMFWVDLSSSKLIGNGLSTATPTVDSYGSVTGSQIDLFLPQAKIGRGNYVSVYSGGPSSDWGLTDTKNYYVVAVVKNADCLEALCGTAGSTSISVQQAFNIDNKIDDGFPQSGRVLAVGFNMEFYSWVGAYDPAAHGPVVAGDGVSTASSATTCYDNGASGGTIEKYSLSQNNGAGLNCALSFQFQ